VDWVESRSLLEPSPIIPVKYEYKLIEFNNMALFKFNNLVKSDFNMYIVLSKDRNISITNMPFIPDKTI